MSMTKVIALSVLIPVGLSVALPAAAFGPGGNRGMERPAFSELDLNGDGQLTLEELEGQAEARFASHDTDGDGLLSRDELVASAMERVEAGVDARLERFDDNEDGMLSANELDDIRPRGPNPERMFGRMDADDDGIVTEAEFEEAAAQMGQRRHGQGHGQGQGHDRG